MRTSGRRRRNKKEPEKEEICLGETLASSQVRVWNLRTVNEGGSVTGITLQPFPEPIPRPRPLADVPVDSISTCNYKLKIQRME